MPFNRLQRSQSAMLPRWDWFKAKFGERFRPAAKGDAFIIGLLLMRLAYAKMSVKAGFLLAGINPGSIIHRFDYYPAGFYYVECRKLA